jgi:hypothetical protein
VLDACALVVRGNHDAEEGRAHVRFRSAGAGKNAMQRQFPNPTQRRVYDTSFLQREIRVQGLGIRD